MSNFFNDTLEGLLEAISIENGEVKMEEIPDMPTKKLRSADLVKNEIKNLSALRLRENEIGNCKKGIHR